MQYIIITSSPEVAQFVEQCGVGRIMVDMETRGKEVRQKDLNLVINPHSFSDVKKIKKSVKRAEVMLRINSLHEKTKEEVEKAIDSGADCIMLPYFHHQNEVKEFLDIVDGRAKTNILLETAAAAARAIQILSLPGIDEVHFGLNDLKISLKHDFLFESLSGGFIEFLCSIAKKNNISYGIGGVGRIGHGLLSADLIIKEYVRLGSQRAILSRTFHGSHNSVEAIVNSMDFKDALQELKSIEEAAHCRTKEQQVADCVKFCEEVNTVSQNLMRT